MEISREISNQPWQTLIEQLFDSSFTLLGLPVGRIVLFIVILLLAQLFNGLFTRIVLTKIADITRQTTSEIDDKLIELLKQPLSWLILIGGFWLAQLVIVDYLKSEYVEIIHNLLSFAVAVTFAYILYNASPLLGEVIRNLTVQTENKLDDLLAPFLPKIFQLVAILLVILKGGEVFLGASAGALLGLLGGAGVAIGLLFKDLIYDTCCAVIIYLDQIYQPGDIIKIDGVPDQVKVEEIGLRSTTVYLVQSNSLRKFPNSRMISGIVENCSQNLDSEVAK